MRLLPLLSGDFYSGDKFQEVGFSLPVTLSKQKQTEPALLAKKGHSSASKSRTGQRRALEGSLCLLAVEGGSRILH